MRICPPIKPTSYHRWEWKVAQSEFEWKNSYLLRKMHQNHYRVKSEPLCRRKLGCLPVTDWTIQDNPEMMLFYPKCHEMRTFLTVLLILILYIWREEWISYLIWEWNLWEIEKHTGDKTLTVTLVEFNSIKLAMLCVLVMTKTYALIWWYKYWRWFSKWIE